MDPAHTDDLPSATDIMNQEQVNKTHILYEDDTIVLVRSHTKMSTCYLTYV